MSDEVLTTIEATVITKTKEALLKHCDVLGLTVGEVIDRLVLNFAVEEPEIAANILGEEFVIMVTNQTEEQVRETIKNLAATLIMSLVQCGVDEADFYDEISDCIHERLRERE